MFFRSHGCDGNKISRVYVLDSLRTDNGLRLYKTKNVFQRLVATPILFFKPGVKPGVAKPAVKPAVESVKSVVKPAVKQAALPAAKPGMISLCMAEFESCCNLSNSQKKRALCLLRVIGDANEGRQKRQKARIEVKLLVGRVI